MDKNNPAGRTRTSLIAAALLVGSLLAPTAVTYADDTLTG